MAESIDLAFDLLPQRLQHPRNANENSNPFVVDRVHDLRWPQLLLEDHRPAKQRWQKHPEKLPKDVAQWQQVQKPHRMHETLIFQVPAHLLFQGSDVG